MKVVIPQQGLSYTAAEYFLPTDSSAWNIRFTNVNNVTEYHENTSVIHIRLDNTGRFTYINPEEPLVLYELLAFSVLPVQGTKIKKGVKWSSIRPSDAEAGQSDAIVAQEKIDYEIVEVDDDHLLVKTTGSARIAPSRGLDTIISKMNVRPGGFDPGMLQYQPYALGTAYFDINKNCVSKAEGTRIPFGYFQAAPSISTTSNRVRYSITLN